MPDPGVHRVSRLNRSRYFRLLIFVILCGSFSCRTLSYYAFSSSRIQGPRYEEILKNLNELPGSDYHQMIEYGRSAEDRPLVVYRFMKPAGERNSGPRNRRPVLLLTGAIHGSEYLAIVHRLTETFIRDLQAENPNPLKSALEAGAVLYVIPVVNPDGYEAYSRFNSDCKDLNRDFPGKETHGMSQPEVKQWLSFLEQELIRHNAFLYFTADYHCCGPQLLRPYGLPGKSLSSESEAAYKPFIDIFFRHFPKDYESGPQYEVLKYKADGVSMDYYHEKYGAVSFIFEGRRFMEHNNLNRHIQWWHGIFLYTTRRINESGFQSRASSMSLSRMSSSM